MLTIHQNTPSLENLLDQAGDLPEPPKPQIAIRRQILPGWIRWPVRVLFLPFMLLDLSAQKIARLLVRTPYKQSGTCKKRGNCCYYILIPATQGLFSALYYFWNTEILGFYRRDNVVYDCDGKKVFLMGCRYLNKNGTCRHYKLRPAVCRKWPIIEYFGYPRILKGCGFKAVAREKK